MGALTAGYARCSTGKKPKLSPSQEAHLLELHRAGRHTTTELAELFTVARSTVYRHPPRRDRVDASQPATSDRCFRWVR